MNSTRARSSIDALRTRVCDANKALVTHRLVTGTSGNVSARDENTGYVVIKPSGVAFEHLTPAAMVVVDTDGNIIDGDLRPSVDTTSHLVVYRELPRVNGIVHTHSPYATSFAVRGEPIPICTTTSAAYFARAIPVSGFAVIGEEAIGREIVEHIGDGAAVLIRNHGPFTVGTTPEEALKYAVVLEETAEVTHLAMLRGSVVPLSDETIEHGRRVFLEGYGQTPSGGKRP